MRNLRLTTVLVLGLLVVACQSQPKHSDYYPEWYINEALLNLEPYEVLGLGEGRSLAEARAVAKEMIAQTLLSRVESSFEKVSTDEVSKSQAKLKVTSDLALHNLTTIKQEQEQEQDKGVFFVALSFRNLDFAQRVKEKLKLEGCKNEQQNHYLAKTPLFYKLNRALGCEKDFRLVRQNQAWYLANQKQLFMLNTGEFEELFISSTNKAFSLLAPKKLFIEGESFHFETSTSKHGYLTLFNVYENGIVTLLQPSVKHQPGLQIPPIEDQMEFEAGLLYEGQATHDLYVAFLTPQPLNMSRFEHAYEDLAESENAYKFDELLELMQKHSYTSLLLRTLAVKN